MGRAAGRSLELLSLLQTADRWSGPELAARLGITLRTLGRDLTTLRELGYPVHASGGRASTYRLGVGGSLPPLILDGEQAVAVSLALQTSPTTVLGLRDAADRALHTLSQVMPPALRAQIDALRVTTVRNYWEFPAPPIAAESLNAVGDAVRRSRLLELDLLRADGSRPDPRDADFVAPLRVEPHHLALWAGRWYLVFFELGRERWSVHRLDRLHPYARTGRVFARRELPGGDVATFVMTSHERGDFAAEWPCRGRVVMELPAATVARFAPGGSVVEAMSGTSSRLTIGAWSWAGIAGILATFDADLRRVEPAELRDACRVLGERFGTVGKSR